MPFIAKRHDDRRETERDDAGAVDESDDAAIARTIGSA